MAKKITITLTEDDKAYKKFMAYKEKTGLEHNKGVLALLLIRVDRAVIIPDCIVEHIQGREWFKLYNDLGEFVVESVRQNMLNHAESGAK